MTVMPTDHAPGLSPSEDGQLRRLFFFETIGATLAPSLRQLKAELRTRDQRCEVRDPDLTLTSVLHYV